MPKEIQIQTPDSLSKTWTFIKLLGEGTSGKTYLARHNESGQQVAVKIMKYSLSSDFKSYELFKRESEVLKAIKVPGVPKVYECETGDISSLSYIIQEYIEYPSLETIMKEQGKLSEQLTIHILQKIAEIIFKLQTNYAPPIIHRDIKPSNVLCDIQGEEIRVALIDFGAVSNPQKRSAASTVAGTFGYMAPEQMLSDVAIQSDYYSLGALALFLLTGIHPCDIDTLDGAFELDYQKAIHEHAPETSAPMLALLSQLIAPDISKRPATPSDLVEKIARVCNGEMPNSDASEQVPRVASPIQAFITAIRKRLFRPRIVNFTQDAIDTWETTTGTVRDADYWKTDYTFEANGRTWCGRISKDTGKKIDQKIEVIYNPKDPRFNYVEI